MAAARAVAIAPPTTSVVEVPSPYSSPLWASSTALPSFDDADSMPSMSLSRFSSSPDTSIVPPGATRVSPSSRTEFSSRMTIPWLSVLTYSPMLPPRVP